MPCLSKIRLALIATLFCAAAQSVASVLAVDPVPPQVVLPSDPLDMEFPYGFWMAEDFNTSFSVYLQDPYEKRFHKVLRDLRKHHVNRIIPANRRLTEFHLDAAQANGMKIATMPMLLYSHVSHTPIAAPKSFQWVKDEWTKHVNEMKALDHPAFLGYHLFDEPLTEHMPAIKELYDHVRALDPEHAVIYTHQCVPLEEETRPEEWQLIQSSPVLLSDLYSLSQTWGRDLWLYGDVAIPDWFRANKNLHNWPIIQSFGYDQVPTVPELRVMVYNAISHGAKGIFFFTTGQSYVTWHPTKPGWIAPGNPWFGEDALISEVSRLGEHLTTAGPLLLPLTFAGSDSVDVDAEPFQSRLRPTLRPDLKKTQSLLTRPAIRAGRFDGDDYDILVVHNLDPWKPHQGRVTVKGRYQQAFDLQTLQPVGEASADGITFSVDFEPGDGRLFLLGDEQDLADATAVVLNRRYVHQRIGLEHDIVQSARFAMTVDDLNGILDAAATSHDDHKFDAALADLDRAQALLLQKQQKNAFFSKAAKLLTQMRRDFLEMNDWILDHPEYLKESYPEHADYAPLTSEVLNLTCWLASAENSFDDGVVDLPAMQALRQRIALHKEKLLAYRPKNLEPVRIAVIEVGDETEGRHDLVRWLGMLYTTVDRVTPDADLSGYDLAWMHIDGESSAVDATFDISATLKADILTDSQIRRLKDYVSHGGGLVLTGLAPSIVKDLGLEKAAPGETYWGTMYTPGGAEMAWETWARCNKVIGLKPTDRAHPLFSNFAEPGFGLESYNESAIVTKSVWSRRKGGWPENGRVLAEYFSDGANIPSAFAVAVEYQVQAGKVLTLGDCFSPRLDESNAGGFISRWNTPYHAFLKNIVQTYRRSPAQPVEDQ